MGYRSPPCAGRGLREPLGASTPRNGIPTQRLTFKDPIFVPQASADARKPEGALLVGLHIPVGMGHSFIRQYEVHSRWAGGGDIRKQRKGRKRRPLSSRHPVHLVLKLHPRRRLSLRQRKNWSLIYTLMKRYGRRFNVRTQQCSIQNNHIHVLLETTFRSDFQAFFRVFAGQIAQQILGRNVNSGPFWKHRLWTCVVRTPAYLVNVKNYIRLNEQEARGKIRYSKLRLKGLSSADWEILWK